MITIIITIILGFFITTLFGHVVHYALHQPWSGKVHKAHLTHHLIKYPPHDFMSDEYRSAGKDSTPKFFVWAGLPLIITPIILWLCGIIPLVIMITILGVEGIIGFLHSYLHDAFHIKNHWLYKVPILGKQFTKLVHLHYLHHVGKMNFNFGIFTFLWDRVCGTFTKSRNKI
jgi:sterol desaturase/sphingolipid hydroxylase (fatty acid hydroxylase superfamily)